MQPGVTYKWEGIKFRGDAVGGAYAISRERDVPSWVRNSPLRSGQTGGRQQSPSFFNVENAAPGGSGTVRARSVSPLRFWQTVQHGPGGGSGTVYDAAHAPQLSPTVGHYHAQSPYGQQLNTMPQQGSFHAHQQPQQLQKQQQYQSYPQQYQPQYNYSPETQQQRGNVPQNQSYMSSNLSGPNYPSYGGGPAQYPNQPQTYTQPPYQQFSSPDGQYYREQSSGPKPQQWSSSPQYPNQQQQAQFQQSPYQQQQGPGQSYGNAPQARQLGPSGQPMNWNDYGGSDNQRGFLNVNMPPTTQYNYKSNISIGTLSEYAHPPSNRRATSRERHASPFGKKSPEWSTSQPYEVDPDKEADEILNQPYRTRPIVKPGIKPATDRIEGSYLAGGMASVGVHHARGQTPQEKFAEFQASHQKAFSPYRDARGNLIIAGPNQPNPGSQNFHNAPQANYNAPQQQCINQQMPRQLSPQRIRNPEPSVDYTCANAQQIAPSAPTNSG